MMDLGPMGGMDATVTRSGMRVVESEKVVGWKW